MTPGHSANVLAKCFEDIARLLDPTPLTIVNVNFPRPAHYSNGMLRHESAQARSVRLWAGATLRATRHGRGFTQIQLADRCGLSNTTWSRFEQGTLALPPELIPQLEEWLEIPTGFLLRTGEGLSLRHAGSTGTAAWRFRKAKEAIVFNSR